MKLYSTNNKNHVVSIKEAVLESLPADKGLYMPMSIPQLSAKFLDNLENYTFREIANEVASLFLREDMDPEILKSIVDDAINFPAPVVTIDNNISILELFHGPTLAFKDFGARFMARLMNYFWSENQDKLHILVATSGDTGGAVAAGFYGLTNIEVVILYPKGKVSQLQEKQLTTWGKNIQAIEVDGDFDDCQKMVKEAFLDPLLTSKLNLSSANSINIARLIPQTFYYFEAKKQLKKNVKVSFCVPSGNFGNLTAGLFAKRMGLPMGQIIAATNINKVVPQYLQSGIFTPSIAKATLSNAMDIGNPSNFARILDLFGSTWNKVRKDVQGYSFTDDETIKQIQSSHKDLGYIMDPHTAVGLLAAKKYKTQNPNYEHIIVLSTAHPIKFRSEMEKFIDFSIAYPASIHKFFDGKSNKTSISNEYLEFKNHLLSL